MTIFFPGGGGGGWLYNTGLHIFGRLQGKAVDNHFIYLEISPEQDFTTFFERIESKQRFSRKIKSNQIKKFLFKVEISITHNISSSELLNRLSHKKYIQV